MLVVKMKSHTKIKLISDFFHHFVHIMLMQIRRRLLFTHTKNGPLRFRSMKSINSTVSGKSPGLLFVTDYSHRTAAICIRMSFIT